MSKAIYLDPEKTASYEPSEGDERNSSRISSFGVPRSVNVHDTSANEILCLRFDYVGGEIGVGRRTLDQRNDPAILLLVGGLSGKIIEMNFSPPVKESELATVGDRLVAQAATIGPIATRFNFQMIGAILRNWRDLLCEA